MDKREIILVRHGETEENVREIFRGRLDPDLNETGFKQAELAADYLKDLKIKAIYTSPLKRALETAKTIAKLHNLTPRISEGLIDFDFGQWQGLSHQEVKAKYPVLYEKWHRTPHLVKTPKGEKLSAVRESVISATREAIKHKRSVLVSHRVPLKVLICDLLGLKTSRFWNVKIDVAGITIFEYDPENGSFILTKHNDTSHLKPIAKEVLADF